MAGSDRRHGPRRPGKYRRSNLAESDPDGLQRRHLLHALGLEAAVSRSLAEPCVDDPHNDSANQQGPSDYRQAFQVVSDFLVQQPCWAGRDHKGDQDQREWMREDGADAWLAAGEGRKEPADLRAEVDRQTKNRAELNDD